MYPRQDSNLRPLGYELTGRCLPRYARPHSCRPATFSRPTCLAPSRLFASVPPRSVSKSVANPLTDKDGRLAAMIGTRCEWSAELSADQPLSSEFGVTPLYLCSRHHGDAKPFSSLPWCWMTRSKPADCLGMSAGW